MEMRMEMRMEMTMRQRKFDNLSDMIIWMLDNKLKFESKSMVRYHAGNNNINLLRIEGDLEARVMKISNNNREEWVLILS